MSGPKIIKFDVYYPGDQSAGLHSYTDSITVTVESGDPGGEPGEFEVWMCVILSEWFNGASVQQVK